MSVKNDGVTSCMLLVSLNCCVTPRSSCMRTSGVLWTSGEVHKVLWRKKWAHEVGFAVNQKKKKQFSRKKTLLRSGEENQEVCGNTGEHLAQHVMQTCSSKHSSSMKKKKKYTNRNAWLCITQEVVASVSTWTRLHAYHRWTECAKWVSGWFPKE